MFEISWHYIWGCYILFFYAHHILDARSINVVKIVFYGSEDQNEVQTSKIQLM
jgi:hypothetical protein